MGTCLLRILVFAGVTGGLKMAHAQAPDTVRHVSPEIVLASPSIPQMVEAYAPLIVPVSIANHGQSPLRLKARPDGAPLQVAFEVSAGIDEFVSYSLWLRRVSPEAKEITLQAGQTTNGDIFVLLDYDKGYVFANPGLYNVRWRFYPGKDTSVVYSDTSTVRVIAQSAGNKAALSDLQRLALSHYGGDELPAGGVTTPEMKAALDGWGSKLLGKIVAQDTPHLVAPEENPQDRKEAELVQSLEALLQRHPDSAYSGYVARFLGLVYLKTFEHEVSHSGGEGWDTERLREHPAHAKASAYLADAEKRDLWPRPVALASLTTLHVMAKEWEQADSCLNKLKTDYQAVGGAQVATHLEQEMNKFKAKLERVKAAPIEKP